MEAIFDECWDWGGGYSDDSKSDIVTDTRTPEEKLTSKLIKSVDKPVQSKPPRQNKEPDRAFLYLQENWELIYNHTKDNLFCFRQEAILYLLKNHFGEVNEAPIKYFLVKKGIFSFGFYKCVAVFFTAIISYVTHIGIMVYGLPPACIFIPLICIVTCLVILIS